MERNKHTTFDLKGLDLAVGDVKFSVASGLGSKVLNIDGKVPLPRRGILKSTGSPSISEEPNTNDVSKIDVPVMEACYLRFLSSRRVL
jgi:hypothetical protein